MAVSFVCVSTGTRTDGGDPIAGLARRDAIAFLDHGGYLDPAMARRQKRGERDELAADHDRTGKGPEMLQIDHLL
jgi:hypothetical protein